MQRQILHTLRKHALIPAESLLIVAVSGGADSLALLHILRQLAPRLRCRLHAATFDHHLRGEAGADDARYVVQTAEAWGIPATAGAADVRDLAARQKLSIEAAARLARYNFLAGVARQTGAARVAVAHHADDQAETVLLHLLRGAGIAGLGGMSAQAPLPGHPDLTLIRPLLAVTRADIEAYCRTYDLHPREDATNADAAYLRNRLRHELLPYLQQVNPQITRVLAQLADIAAVEDDYVMSQVRQITGGAAVQHDGGRVSIERRRFGDLHPALQRRVVAWAAAQVAGSARDVEYQHIVAAVAVAQRGRLGAVAELPGGVRLRVDYDSIMVELASAPQPLPNVPLLDEGANLAVSLPGVTKLSARWALVAGREAPDAAAGGSAAINSVGRLAIPAAAAVTVRTRQDGDRFAPAGMGGHTQKLSRWLVNHKIPRHLRSRLPLIVVNGEIAAIFTDEGWTAAHRFRADDANQHIVYFEFRQFS